MLKDASSSPLQPPHRIQRPSGLSRSFIELAIRSDVIVRPMYWPFSCGRQRKRAARAVSPARRMMTKALLPRQYRI